MAPAVAVLREELLRGIWPSECQVGHMRGDLCLCLCQGLQWKPRHVHGSQSYKAEQSANSFICSFSKMAPRALLKQSCFFLSSAQPSTTGADFKSKTQLAVALDLINSCWDIQPVDKLGVQHVCPPASFQLPLSPPGFGEEVVGCSNLTSLLAKWFCAWMRDQERLTWDKCVLCQVFTFPSCKGTSCAWNWASDRPVQALVVLWVCSGSGRAGQGLKHHPSVALKCVCLPRHCQALFWGSWRVIQRRWEELSCGRSSASGFCR